MKLKVHTEIVIQSLELKSPFTQIMCDEGAIIGIQKKKTRTQSQAVCYTAHYKGID